MDQHGRSYGWEDELIPGPYYVLKDFTEAYRALNIPLEGYLNPEIRLSQNKEFSNCEGEEEVSVPSGKEGKLKPTYSALMSVEDRSQRKLYTRTTITALAKLSSPC